MATSAMTSELESPANRPEHETHADGGTSPLRWASSGTAVAGRVLRGTAADVASRLPEAAVTGRTVAEDAMRRIRASSDEMLAAGTALAFGVVVGMQLGGANRLLVAAALLPAGAMGLTLLDRSGSGRRPSRRSD